MRLWSLHPRYLDAKGLVALWREGLLARKVLSGATIGYRNHPQLERFKTTADPVLYIDAYLAAVCDEADSRGYRFDRSKIDAGPVSAASSTTATPSTTATRLPKIPLASGQLAYELAFLAAKLEKRDPERHRALPLPEAAEVHPLFAVVPGPIAGWEKPKLS